MFTCILCARRLPDDDRSEEHVFQRAVGGTLTTDEVCKGCNDKMGANVDATLVEHQAMQFARRRFRLRGYSGRIPQPLHTGHWVEGADTAAELTGRERTVTWEGRQVRVRLRSEPRPDGTEVIRHPAAQATEAMALKAKIERRRPGVVVVTEVEEGGNLSFPLSLEDDSWLPGALKTAYELACLSLGEGYLAEPSAELIRTLIGDPEVSAATIRASALRLAVSGPGDRALSGIKSRPGVLAGAVFSRRGRTLSYVKFFDSFEAWFDLGATRQMPRPTSAVLIDVVAGSHWHLPPIELLSGNWADPQSTTAING